MFNKTAELFISKNGLHGVERLRHLANQNAPLHVIADTFKVSVSTAGRLQTTLLKKVYYISDATADWLKYCEQRHLFIADAHRNIMANTVPKDAHITLIHGTGGKND